MAWAAAVVATSLVVTTLVAYQLRPSHPTQYGHWAAGRWLAEGAGPRARRDGAGYPGLGPVHLGIARLRLLACAQALDQCAVFLTWSWATEGELAANARARTLDALLAYAATPVVSFPLLRGPARDVGVTLYRFHQPGSWEGLVP